MKQGSFRAVRLLVFLLVMMSMTVLSVFSDENTVDLMGIVLDPFDGTTEHSWSYGGRTYTYDFEWALDASKFTTEEKDRDGNVTRSFPLKTQVPSWPMALYGMNRDGKDIQSLGIWGRFDRRGYNWIDVYPIKTGSAESDDGPEPFEIPIPGRIQYLDMWVWGSNLRYYIEVFFRDHQGVVYGLRLGDLGYQGWRNLRTRIPTSIPQSKRVLPRLASLSFVKFRIWTTPTERVDNFYIYFNQLKVLTDTFESLFDGDELADPKRVNELWGQE
jgi:hypothetical protein